MVTPDLTPRASAAAQLEQAALAATPGRVEITTADPRFDPYREVWVNGWCFAPVGRPAKPQFLAERRQPEERHHG